MNIIYKITYLPHLQNKTPPYYYIGSKFKYNNNYLGSLSSKQKDWYTEDLTIEQWWKKNTKKNPENFLFEILESYDKITPKQLVEEEKKIHLNLDVRDGVEYFNKAIATTGWVASNRTEESKNKVRKITQQYWDENSEDAIKRRITIGSKI